MKTIHQPGMGDYFLNVSCSKAKLLRATSHLITKHLTSP